MLDHKTMEQPKVRKLSSRKQIYVHQGNLDDEKLKEIPEDVMTIVVTGNVFFVSSNTMISSEMIVLGDCDMRFATIERSLSVNGKTKAEKLTVGGNLKVRPDAEIQNLTVLGEVIYIR